VAKLLNNPLTIPGRNIPPAANWLALAQSNLQAATALATHTSPQPHEAVYLAGFALELALKGKGLLEGVGLPEIHALEELWVRSQLLRKSRTDPVPTATAGRWQFDPVIGWDVFMHVNSRWHNEQRYSVGTTTANDAREFVDAVSELVRWLWTA